MTLYQLWDDEEMEYICINEDFKGLKECIADVMINRFYPAIDEYKTIHDVETIDELKKYASGLDLEIEVIE